MNIGTTQMVKHKSQPIPRSSEFVEKFYTPIAISLAQFLR